MCIFCSIADGSIPSKKVYEDNDVLAFLDLSQATYGHTLVVPKKHFDNILDVDSETLAKVMEVVRILSKKIVTNLNADGVNILNNCNEAAGQSVMHFHVHIIPRYANDDIVINFNEHKLDLDEVLTNIKRVK